MKKRLLVIFAMVLVSILALFAFSACNLNEVPYDTELVLNGTFDEFTTADKNTVSIDGWRVSSTWDSKKSKYELKYSSEGEQFLKIENSTAGYAYLYQQIKVDRNATYRVTVDIKLDGSVKKGQDEVYYGAYVSFLENTSYRFVEQREYYNNPETANWKSLTFYVKATNTDYLTICLALGGENGAAKGVAFYDNVSMMKVESVPEGVSVTNFKKSDIVRYNINVSGILFVTMLCLFSVLVLAGGYVLVRRLYSKQNAFLNFNQVGATVTAGGKVSAVKKVTGHPAFVATMLAVGAFLVNLVFLLAMYGFGSEMNYTVNLALKMAQNGGVLNAFTTYANTLKTTSPGTLYILAIVGAAGKNLSYADIAVLIRLVNTLATVATVVMIYLYGRKYVGDRTSTIFAAVYALLPITLIMGGLDHTFTAVLVALLVGAMILLVEKKYLATYLVFALAIVLDVRAMALATLALVYMGYRYYRDDSDLKKFTANRAMIIFGLIGAFVVVYLLTLPAALNHVTNGKPFYGFTLIANQVTGNNVMTDNALGLFGMAAQNEKPMNRIASILNVLVLVVIFLYVATLYFKNRNKQEVLMLASFTFALISVITLKVDYTYLFLALALGFIYTMISGEKRMYGILAGYSVLAFLNVGQLMSNSGFVASSIYFDDFFRTANTTAYFANYETTSPEFIVFSVFTVLLTIYYAYVSYSIANNGKRVDIPAMPDKFRTTLVAWFKDVPGHVASLFKKEN